MSSEPVVIVDYSATQLKILERLANSVGGWTAAKGFGDAEAALSFCRANPPGLLVLAAATAQGEASALIHRLRRLETCAEVPVMVIVDWPNWAVLADVSVSVLLFVVGLGENDPVTPLGKPDTAN